jgi:hypothetical protein
VIERIDDMPAGTIGLRASGKLSRDDYRRRHSRPRRPK